jgi:hypothetical protein
MQPANNGQPADKGHKLRSVHATEQVAHLWANGVGRFIRNAQETASTSTCGRILYSYAQAIAARTDAVDAEGRRVYLFNADARESTTTQKHMRNASRAVPFHVFFSASSSTGTAWDGRRETIVPTTYLYLTNGADKAPTTSHVLTFSVHDVHADNGHAHAANYKRLFERAASNAREMAKRRSHFYPSHVAQTFRAAAEYRALFCADYCADLADSFDWDALATSFAKVLARKEKAEREALARSASFRRAELEWMTAVAPTLTDLTAVMRAEAGRGGNALRDAVIAFETSGLWDTAAPSAPAHARVRACILALIREGAAGFCDAAERVGLKVLPAFSLPVDGAIRPPCAAMVRCYPKPPTRKVFGREVSDEYSNVRQVYDAVGLERYDSGLGFRSARLATGRDLLFVRQGGDEVITSSGARVPVAIVAALWRRHAAEIVAAATNPVALTFPETRRVGPFAWIGYDLGDSGARATDGGESVLLIGCHKVAAADVARLARRLGWTAAEAEASA